MTQEEKELLLKDLCARLPYRPKVLVNGHLAIVLGIDENVVIVCIDGNDYKDEIIVSTDNNSDDIKPYIRTMSNMTEEERKEFINYAGYEIEESVNGRHYEYYLKDFVGTVEEPISNVDAIDWLNAHHFDFRNLIERGLAIAVTEENNPYK